MAKKRRRKPGLQSCSICGRHQLVQELQSGICLMCLGLVGVKQWRPKGSRQPEEMQSVEGAATGV